MARWRDIKQGKVKKEPPLKTPSITPAPIADRLKAFLTDTFMITMPIIYIIIYFVMGSREGFREHMAEGWLYILIPHYLIVTALWTFKGQTPGMKAYDIKVVRWSDPKKLPNFFQSTIRYFAMPISILSVIGLLIALFREDRQTLHDLISLTRTIKDA
ncbi:MAG: RDD family protein [Epsilonproteobacteria bacterium]|nr:RDD family protein [Campylobacterota bacterium]NPA63992.1 RDD family protein [Campylobacterota bacterium]